MDDLLSVVTTQILPHWPFGVVVVIFAIIGQVMSKSVFTRERAYKKQKASALYRFWESQSFWWWGRETLPLHSILGSAPIGLIWLNPEGADPAWTVAASVGYFAGAGAVSLVAWALAKGYLKKRGIDLELPGGSPSLTPPPYEKTSPPDKEVIEESENA